MDTGGVTRMGSFMCLIAAMFAGVVFAGGQAAASERFEFDAPSFEAQGGFISWSKLVEKFAEGTPTRTVHITGTLTIPDKASVPVPAVIVAHTSNGPGGDMKQAEAMARALGYATLVYDSYKPRGFVNNNAKGNGGPRLEMNQAIDAFVALKQLGANPKIDGRRIALIGVSAGGNTALLGSIGWIHDRYAGAGTPPFAALIAFYPGGYFLPQAKDILPRSPILVLPGERDDFMSWPRTKLWVDYVKRERPDVPLEAIPVPNAYHSYLNPDSVQRFNPDNPRVDPSCGYWLASSSTAETAFLHSDGQAHAEPFDFAACGKRGSNTGYSGPAMNFTYEKMGAFLKQSFEAVK